MHACIIVRMRCQVAGAGAAHGGTHLALVTLAARDDAVCMHTGGAAGVAFASGARRCKNAVLAGVCRTVPEAQGSCERQLDGKGGWSAR